MRSFSSKSKNITYKTVMIWFLVNLDEKKFVPNKGIFPKQIKSSELKSKYQVDLSDINHNRQRHYKSQDIVERAEW